MTLQILVSTIDEGINNVASLVLSPIDGIEYIISWQHSSAKEYTLPQNLIREDVKVYHLEGKGLSRNRNNTFRHATADLCLIADDDCRYTPEQLKSIIETMQANLDVDLAAFKETFSQTNNFFPEYSFNLKKMPKGYHISSIDIVFRRASVQGKLEFNELFGFGAPLGCGEEEIFLINALKSGLNCVYYPIEIVSHVGISTIANNRGRKDILMGRGAYIFIAYPLTSLLRVLLVAYRLKKSSGVPFRHSVKYMFNGIKFYLQSK